MEALSFATGANFAPPIAVQLDLDQGSLSPRMTLCDYFSNIWEEKSSKEDLQSLNFIINKRINEYNMSIYNDE